MRRIALITTALVLGACSDAPQKTVYQHDQCHRLTLIDEDKGMEILGAEDIVRLPDGDLLVSAYDRRGRDESGMPPEGGLYVVPKSALNNKTLNVSSVIKSLTGGLRPHGIDAIELEDKTLRIAFVNRGATSNGKRFPSIVTFELDGQNSSRPVMTPSYSLCRANDLAFNKTKASPPTLLITHDRKHCAGFDAFYENVLGKTLGFVRFFKDKTPFVQGIAFPNGIGIQFPDRPLGDNNFLAIAETRANRISYHPKTSARDTVDLPGSPDNLTIWRPGIILAALHPSLVRLALYRYKWPSFALAPSRVVKVSGTQVLTLFDDPTGEKFSAASVAVQTAGKLVLGSVGDSGLLVCGGRSTS
ncbi:MAG: hypothetical protein ABJM86_02745 [Hyphomicrobiales bacterium]